MACAIDGAFYATGQRCTASSRIIVTEAIHDRFVEALAERARSLAVGDALDRKRRSDRPSARISWNKIFVMWASPGMKAARYFPANR